MNKRQAPQATTGETIMATTIRGLEADLMKQEGKCAPSFRNNLIRLFFTDEELVENMVTLKKLVTRPSLEPKKFAKIKAALEWRCPGDWEQASGAIN